MPPSSREIKGYIKKQCAIASRVTEEQWPSTGRRLDRNFGQQPCFVGLFLASRVSLVNWGIEKARFFFSFVLSCYFCWRERILPKNAYIKF
ncbi:hypothetical protein CEXT_316461 [Caerostris extrusa]|uniref:Uncharacterized protein n=1 Tax=Caerostris extrusa TaxID=172846 RepID=A0AAV4VLK0_CAEEX|nr:hypothetical protein CEXT_316461 [Caerostris extrusa]